jgi:hypothetical protein
LFFRVDLVNFDVASGDMRAEEVALDGDVFGASCHMGQQGGKDESAIAVFKNFGKSADLKDFDISRTMPPRGKSSRMNWESAMYSASMVLNTTGE